MVSANNIDLEECFNDFVFMNLVKELSGEPRNAFYTERGAGLKRLVPSIIHRLYEIEGKRKFVPMEVQWKFHSNQSIQLQWHGAKEQSCFCLLKSRFFFVEDFIH